MITKLHLWSEVGLGCCMHTLSPADQFLSTPSVPCQSLDKNPLNRPLCGSPLAVSETFTTLTPLQVHIEYRFYLGWSNTNCHPTKKLRKRATVLNAALATPSAAQPRPLNTPQIPLPPQSPRAPRAPLPPSLVFKPLVCVFRILDSTLFSLSPSRLRALPPQPQPRV